MRRCLFPLLAALPLLTGPVVQATAAAAATTATTATTTMPTGRPKPPWWETVQTGTKSARARHVGALGAVGALFARNGASGHFCTAAVVHSRHHDLILTAAHCLYSGHAYLRNVVFVPRYNAGSRPLGTWRVRRIVVAHGWIAHADQNLDFGFATLYPRGGHQVEDLTSGYRLGTGRGFRNRVRVVGYPKLADDPRDTPISCVNTTSREGTHQMRFDCDGYTTGTSGSPWLVGNTVVGVIGGFHQGGKSRAVSYSAYFDGRIKALYAKAQKLP